MRSVSVLEKSDHAKLCVRSKSLLVSHDNPPTEASAAVMLGIHVKDAGIDVRVGVVVEAESSGSGGGCKNLPRLGNRVSLASKS